MPRSRALGKSKIYNLTGKVEPGARERGEAGKMYRGKNYWSRGTVTGSRTMSQLFGWVAGALIVAGGGVLSVWWINHSRYPEPEPDSPVLPVLAHGMTQDPPPRKTEFATGDEPKGKVVDVKFDPERALKYLKQLCELGPRISGSQGMRKQQELIEKHFKDLGATVTAQKFQAKQKSRKEPVEMTNLIVSWHPNSTRRILICTHYDTRPIADQERDRANWNKPFVSANDGTSGVAFLMELGHHMKDIPCEFGVDFVFFDGEEYVFEPGFGGDKYFFGSEHFAEQYLKERNQRKHRYDAGLLLDLFAGKNAQLKVEVYSFESARPLVEQVWGIAKSVGAKSFKFEAGYEVQDDHLALIRAGIPTIDIIDFDYPHWHKLSDTPDKVSGEQMAEVSKVITTWLQKIK